MIQILLVDDHVLVRLGLIEAIEMGEGMKVVADVSSGKKMLEKYEELSPDIVVMDYRMPEEDGVEMTRQLLDLDPDAKILMLSVYEGEEDVWRAVSAGVHGYLSKSADVADLREAISSIMNGSQYFPERIAKKISQRHERKDLTKREATILSLLVQGLSNKEMSQKLEISVPTVKLHVGNTIAKLGVNDRTQAAIVAVQRGIIHLDG